MRNIATRNDSTHDNAMLIFLAVIGLLTLLLLIGLLVAVLRLPSTTARDLTALAGDLRAALEKSLGDQKADFRDVTSGTAEQLRQLVQQSLTQQQLILDQRFLALQQMTDARLQEIRANVEKRLQENLEQNFGAFKEMSQSLVQLKSSADQMLTISAQVSELNHILASPKLQGNFGETALEKLLADILPPQAYEWQPRIAEGLQPDAAIKIRGVRLCIDAKFPKDRIALVLDSALDETARASARRELAATVRQMASDIGKKYVRPDLGTADQAFLFVPSESLYYEILKMPDLAEHCRKVKVSPVSPNTLAATLYAVALAFRGYEMQENAKTILRGIQDMDRHFQNFREDFSKIGQRLQQAQDDYTKAGRDLERFDKTIAKLKEGDPLLPPT